jgi:GNAT superfamily N-acetyltransferase
MSGKYVAAYTSSAMPDHPIPPEVVALCENAQSHSPVWPGAELIRCDGFDVWLGPPIYPGLTVVLNIRRSDARALLDEARAVIRDRGRSRVNWMIGSHSPVSLPDDLLALGLVDDIDPELIGLVAAREPDGVDRTTEVRRVETRDDMHAFFRVQQEAFGSDRNASPEGEDHIDAMFDAERDRTDITTYLAYLDGEPVATARATFAEHGVVMNGGSTLPRARGRGIYRALVTARWDDAVARGTPYLTTVARPTSAPILARMGLVEVCRVRELNDVL